MSFDKQVIISILEKVERDIFHFSDGLEQVNTEIADEIVNLSNGNHLSDEDNEDDTRKTIFSTGDISDLIEYKFRAIEDEAVDESFEEYVIMVSKELLALGYIYEAGNRDSYINLVRNRGFISQTEFIMSANIVSNEKVKIEYENRKKLGLKGGCVPHQTTYMDTEFPVDPKGFYII